MSAFATIDRPAFLRFAAEHPEHRYELDRGRIVQQMTGGTRRHGLVARRIAQIIEDQIDPARWTVLTDRGVGVGMSSRNADVVVEPSNEPLDSLETERPALIVEVLSPSTTGVDLNTKPGEYLSIATLDAYIVASQTEASVLIWLRGSNGQFPQNGEVVTGFDQSISINGRGFALTVMLEYIYRGIVGPEVG
jgi:Uma2 family endonuclease